jgi:hypothetical protein
MPAMNDPSPSPLYIVDPASTVRIPRMLERAFLWTLGGLGSLATLGLLVFAVATQSGADSERIVGTSDYATGLVSALATAQARGRR